MIAMATYTITRKTQQGEWGSPTVFKHLQRLYGNTKPRGIALDLGFGVPRGGQGVYECYGHGTCGGVESSFKCTCVEGWFGNCNMATCPVGPAWFDEAWADDRAHRPVECSNQGNCNRATGVCACSDGFYGSACQFQKCVPETATPCNGRGRCKSIRDLALESRFNGEVTPYEYGASTAPVVGDNMDNGTVDKVWDADMVHGCACDSAGYMYGELAQQRAYKANNANDNTAGNTHHLQNGTEYFGHSCALRRCPPGDDPKTVSANKTFETQNLTCAATNGTYALSFRSVTTEPLSCNSTTLFDLETALESLTSVGAVSVSGWWSLTDTKAVVDPLTTVVCDTTAIDWGSGRGTLVVGITFKTELGDIPLLQVEREPEEGDILITEAQKGTKENDACSGRGICDENTGYCDCFVTVHMHMLILSQYLLCNVSLYRLRIPPLPTSMPAS